MTKFALYNDPVFGFRDYVVIGIYLHLSFMAYACYFLTNKTWMCRTITDKISFYSADDASMCFNRTPNPAAS